MSDVKKIQRQLVDLNKHASGGTVQDIPPVALKTPFMPADGEDMLMDIMIRQGALQGFLGFNFQEMGNEERIDFLKTHILALTDELHEALGEIGWKPWASSRHINREEFKGELIDAFHFLINLFLAVQVGPHEIWQAYVAKNERNFARQREGYDGVSTKCKVCKMALDEPEHYYNPNLLLQRLCSKECHDTHAAFEESKK